MYQEFERISERGGVLGTMDTPIKRVGQRGKIQEESMYYEHKKHDGSLPLVGVNTFLPEDGHGEVGEIELMRSSDDEKIQQVAQQERKVMTLQTIPDCGDGLFATRVGNVTGFSLHAGVATKANERAKLERLCRYITRPAIATKRLSMTRNGSVRYELKTPWRNGTTHVIFEPLDFMYRTYGMPRAQDAQERPLPGWFC